MKKVIGFLALLCMIASLGLGTVGCGKDDKKEKKEKEAEKEKEKKEKKD